ncbi:unnamed protein product [Brassica rapa subsp. narinosa]
MTSTRENEKMNGMEGVRFGRCRIKPGPHGNASVAFCLYEKCMKGPNEMIAMVEYGYTRVRAYELLILLVVVPSVCFKVPPCALVSLGRWRLVADVVLVVLAPCLLQSGVGFCRVWFL